MIPKRAISALIATAFALALLFSFKTPATPALAGSTTSGTAIVGQPTPSADSKTAGPATPGTPATPVTAANPGTPATPGTAATPGTPATVATSAYADGTVTGPVVATRYGDIQVQVTISGGVLTDVAALQLPSGDGRTDRISSVAGPMLREEALTAQSAQIDLLSGATYTSRGYAASLQAALDQAAA